MQLTNSQIPAKIKEHYIKLGITLIKAVSTSSWEIIVYARELGGDFDYWILCSDTGKWELSIY